ncbi:MAG TPA: murein biosynthesis integral membrane protein MurJ [Gemmatimonadales bacterium]|nr:murein biosynthesis integral membrane protein MurJ [Gemmatimonadales bacterium]
MADAGATSGTAGPAGRGGRHAAEVAGGILLTRVLGYLRERAVAHYIGNGWAADALSVGQRLANTIRNLLSEGTLSASFIPVYAALNERDEKAGRALAGAMLGLLLIAAAALALIGIAFAPALTTIFGAGLSGESRALAVSLTRLFFPMSGFMIISAWCLGILNTHRRFFLPYAAPAIWNVAGIAGLVVTATWLVSPALPTAELLTRLALALAWGSMAGSVLQVAIQLPACWQVLHGLPVRWSLRTEGVRNVLLMWGPVVLGAGVAQISGLIDTLFGTLAGEGGASSLRYAQLLQVLPISLFGTSVAAVSLPDLSRDAQGATPNEQLRARIALGFRRIVFFILPSSLAFVVLGPVIVRPLFQTGRFAAADTELVGGVLAAYGVGLLGQACVKLFQSGFYALRDTKTPVKIASASLALSSLLAYVLMRRFGPAGIALGSSLGATVNVVFHLKDLDARVGAILGRTEWRAFAVSLLTSGVAAAAGLGAARLASGTGPLLSALAALAIFGAVYFAGTMALRHPDARRLWTFLR